MADGIGLAHDAGNLLGAIRLYCDLLALPGVLRSEHRHYAEELRHLSQRSGSLIDRLLRTGTRTEREREDAKSPAIDREAVVRLTEVVAGCRGLLEKIAGPCALLVSVEAGVASAVAVEREAVERILINLTKNAAAAAGTLAAPDRASISIAVRVRRVAGRERESVALSVEDRGRGIAPETVRALLSGDAPRGAAPGRGIGLRVVRELVERTSGELRIERRPGGGTTVEIVWPVAVEQTGETG